MKLFLIITCVTLLILVRSHPVERKKEVICEFFKKIEEFHAEQWEDSVNLLKTFLGQAITDTSAYPKYRKYTEFLHDYLESGKSINQSTSVQKKMEYFLGFLVQEKKPVFDLTSERELERPFENYRSSLKSVLSKFYSKYIQAGQDMMMILSASNVAFTDELFMLLYQYPPEYKGSRIQSLGSRILVFQDRYQCV